MTYSYDGLNYVLILKKDEELLEQLQNFLHENDISAAWCSGIGGTLEVELGYYDLEKREYEWQTFAQTAEITSLQGTIARDEHNKPVVHLHGTFSDEAYRTIGGHVRRLVVGGTCEFFIQTFSGSLRRQFDDETGLRTIQL